VSWNSVNTTTAPAWARMNTVPAVVGDHQPAIAATTLAAIHRRLPATTTWTAGRPSRGREPSSHNPAA
jgi:hypothetical protein